MSRWRHSPSMFLSSPPLLLVLLLLLPLASSQGSTRWQTLSGNSPLVVARGGVSGIFPDSSVDAYQLAQLTSLPDLVLWCDVQLTKDGVGICAPSLMLNNCTDVDRSIKNKNNQYIVNGVLTKGYFSLDFTFDDLAKVVLAQGVFSRPFNFNSRSPILTVEDVAGLKPQGLWLNIQHDVFYTQHKLSMRSYVLSVSRRVVINYISSPEEGFLRSIASRFNPKITKFIFRIMGPDDVDPSTNKTYSSSLKDLATIKKFASGILVPKSYIWPVGADMYLQPHTSLVSDAHKAGLEVFASEFYNDVPSSYNYSYDPVSEYLYFIDNGDFTVDGVLSDFPITPSNAIDCFSHLGSNASEQVTLTVISKNGASGDYPGCTDLAYQKAIADGVDVLDCSVQMSKDGMPFCLSTINLIDSTTVAQSSFSNLAQNIPELSGNGIYTFTMTWDDIKTLKPAISNPYAGGYRLFRNPKFKNAGKLLALSDFLALAKNASSLTGVMINIENAAYLIEKQKLAVVDAVLDALSKAGYDNQKNLKVMIQSTNSSVLMKLKDKKNYELVYKVDENIGDALDSTIEDIKQFADSVVVSKSSVFPVNTLFISGSTDVVSKLQSYKLPVYVETFTNEFVSQAWDFFSDPTVEINSYVTGAGVNGVVTDFPMTSARYKRNWCLNLGDKTPPYMAPVQPGSLMQLIAAELLPPAEAPNPVLTAQDVVESPLPSVINSPFSKPGDETVPSRSPNGQPKIAICLSLSSLAALFYIILLL